MTSHMETEEALKTKGGEESRQTGGVRGLSWTQVPQGATSEEGEQSLKHVIMPYEF